MIGTTRSLIVLAYLLFSLAATATVAEAQNIPRNGASLAKELLLILNSLGPNGDSKDTTSLVSTVKENAGQIDSLIGPTRSRVAAESTRAKLACQINDLVLGSSKYINASSTLYLNETQQNWSETCWLSAACIVTPESTADVAVALKIVTALGSKFAVRSGGHNPNSGYASIDGSGVLFDMAKLNILRISADKKTVSVGPGNRWANVYSYLDPYGISAIGGRSPDVGVAGLLLGGGLPYIPSLYGFACDNVQSYRVVLANSTIVNANAQTNPDLWRALRGGGPNFGIVTQFELYTRPLHKIWYSFRIFNQSQNLDLLAATVKVQAALESDPKGSFFLDIVGATSIAGLFYAEYTSEPAIFAPFAAVPSIGQLVPEANGTIFKLATTLAALGGLPKAKREPVALSHLVDLDLYKQIYAKWLSLHNFSSSAESTMSFTIQPIPKAAILAGDAAGGNSMGITPTEQNWYNSLAEWTLSSDDAAGHNAVTSMGAAVKSLSKAKGLYLDYEFQNDCSATQNPLASYGAANLAMLKAASLKYDAEQVFQTLQFGGFKVSKA